MKIVGFGFTVLCMVAFNLNSSVKADCCSAVYCSVNTEGNTMCGDCTATTSDFFGAGGCGYGPCNVFGCNCDGGCRGGCNCGCEKCDYPKNSVCSNCTNTDTSYWAPAPAPTGPRPGMGNCQSRIADEYDTESLTTVEQIAALFTCIDKNKNGLISVDEACEMQFMCDMPGMPNAPTFAQVESQIKQMSGGSLEITPGQFDSKIAGISPAPGPSSSPSSPSPIPVYPPPSPKSSSAPQKTVFLPLFSLLLVVVMITI